jgi:hypothetical protein
VLSSPVRVRSRRSACVPVLALLVASAVAAEDRATGSFESRNWSFELGSAYAFVGDELLGDGRGVVLALTNAAINYEWLDGWQDKRWMIDHYISDTDAENPSLVVYAGFDDKGGLDGFSWYFGSGDGCGFCSMGAIVSTVKIANGRLVGTLKGKADEVAIDVDLDLPVHEGPSGKQVANDAEPAQAFLAFHAALNAVEPAGIWDQLDTEWKKILEGRTPEELQSFYGQLAGERLPPELTVQEVWVDGDRALVVYAGVASYGGKVRGEARMDREEGVWKYDDAWFDAVLE